MHVIDIKSSKRKHDQEAKAESKWELFLNVFGRSPIETRILRVSDSYTPRKAGSRVGFIGLTSESLRVVPV